MAEERIVDDDLNKGVKIRKTKEGLVDAVDELAEEIASDEEVEEISFAYPDEEEEDDEDLVGLSPEEAAALRKQKAEAAERRRAEYEKLVAEGETLLAEENFQDAERIFEQALQLDDPATDASVGYWRAKTANFADPDALISEYADAGIESLEYDLGYEATEILRKEHKEAFVRRYEELLAEEKPLREEFEKKQEHRRSVLKQRKIKGWILFGAGLLPFAVCLILTAVFALKINTIPENTYVWYTAIFGGASFLLLFVFALMTNKLINALRMYRANEKLGSTEDGERIEEIMLYLDVYGAMLGIEKQQEK